MRIYNPYIDKLAGEHTKLLVFDCEFWRVYGNRGYIPIPNTNEFFMPREFGGFSLKKQKDNSWEYTGHFFITLSPPKDLDVSFISSEFATVTNKTADVLDSYQSILQLPWSNAYLNTLPEEQHELLLDGVKTYLNDPIIKNAHKPPSWYKSFLKQYSDSMIVVKGLSDIEAIQNACKFYDIPYSPPKAVYDIATWNAESRRKCGTAKLEGTYSCVIRETDTRGSKKKDLTDILPLGRAHDPSSDAAMTLLVALYIVSRQK